MIYAQKLVGEEVSGAQRPIFVLVSEVESTEPSAMSKLGLSLIVPED
jgi:hypothetical protein